MHTGDRPYRVSGCGSGRGHAADRRQL